MSKELEYIEELKLRYKEENGTIRRLNAIETALKEYDDMLFEIKALENTIKGLEEQIDEKDKSLKALEIIKEKGLIGHLQLYSQLTQEEYDLLKEVLL